MYDNIPSACNEACANKSSEVSINELLNSIQEEANSVRGRSYSVCDNLFGGNVTGPISDEKRPICCARDLMLDILDTLATANRILGAIQERL